MNQNKIPHNKTKIIATVGPASSSKEMLTGLVREGVNVFRLNCSHGTHKDHQKVIDRVREINAEMGSNIALLMDLQGPKIRIGEVADNTELQQGEELIITTRTQLGNNKIISSSYEQLPFEVQKKDKVLLDDGKIALEVCEVQGTNVITRVLHGGILTSRKGINLPNSKISTPSITKKDLLDIDFGLKNQVSWIALSFVRSHKDIQLLRSILTKHNSEARIIAKVEKPEALENIDAILKATDAVMIARGDLGVEMWVGEVPIIQKQLIEACTKVSKPVIVATQMMESMVEHPTPTRAETSDIANAVMDGADALMLSAETATGKYPLETIRHMVRTIIAVESKVDIYYRFRELNPKSPLFVHDSLILAACKLAKDVNAKAIVAMTMSGYTAYRSSSHRPKTNIFVFTANKHILNTMSMVWNTRTYFYDKHVTTDSTIQDVGDILKKDGHLKKGDLFISLASMPIYEYNRTNMMKINVME